MVWEDGRNWIEEHQGQKGLRQNRDDQDWGEWHPEEAKLQNRDRRSRTGTELEQEMKEHGVDDAND